jgi:hypothetical protein
MIDFRRNAGLFSLIRFVAAIVKCKITPLRRAFA